MSTAVTILDQEAAAMLERVVVGSDLARLQPAERLVYYQAVCESVGLNPLTKPFEYITLNGRLVLYARRDATDQLRKLHGVSVTKIERDKYDDLYVVIAYAADKQGRTDCATGAVSLANLRGEALANALMKAETKAKRRVTLSLCGLGMLDESEAESIPGARIGETESATLPRIKPQPAREPARDERDAPRPDPQDAGGVPSYEPFGAITMVTRMAGGQFDPKALAAVFGPGITSKTKLEQYRQTEPALYEASYDKLHADYRAWKEQA